MVNSLEDQIHQLEIKLHNQGLNTDGLQSIEEVERYFLERETEIEQEYLRRKNVNDRDNGGQLEKGRLEQALSLLEGEVMEVEKSRKEAEELKEMEFRQKEKTLFVQRGQNTQYQQQQKLIQQGYKSEMDRINQIYQGEIIRIDRDRQNTLAQLNRTVQMNQAHGHQQNELDMWH